MCRGIISSFSPSTVSLARDLSFPFSTPTLCNSRSISLRSILTTSVPVSGWPSSHGTRCSHHLLKRVQVHLRLSNEELLVGDSMFPEEGSFVEFREGLCQGSVGGVGRNRKQVARHIDAALGSCLWRLRWRRDWTWTGGRGFRRWSTMRRCGRA